MSTIFVRIAAAWTLAAALATGCSDSPSSAPARSEASSKELQRVSTQAVLSFSVPRSWKAQAPGPMRQAQLQLPRAEGDPEGGELIVSTFGAGQGGTVEANLERWFGMFERPDGKPAKDAAMVEKRTVNGLTVTSVDVSGTYVAAVRPGAPEKHNKPGFRMLAAIVETPKGLWFFKLVGPEKTIAMHEKGFAAALETVKL
jgi:hypothetical protein